MEHQGTEVLPHHQQTIDNWPLWGTEDATGMGHEGAGDLVEDYLFIPEMGPTLSLPPSWAQVPPRGVGTSTEPWQKMGSWHHTPPDCLS